jgi:hypothetical protein
MNFTLEPRKSKKQLQKLISIAEKIEGDTAHLLFEVFGKRTSVLYDLAAITDLLDDKPEVLSSLLYLSLAQLFQCRDNRCPQKDLQVSFDTFWSLAVSHLTLSKLS